MMRRVSGQRVVEERLSLSGEGDGVLRDEHEGTLHLIAAVLDGLLAALHTADGQSLDGVADGREKRSRWRRGFSTALMTSPVEVSS